MREIKFRAWFKPLKKMFMVVKELRFKRNGNIIIITNHTGGTAPNSYRLIQFTGLKDKNGKEIFEGDIVPTEKLVDKTLFKAQYIIVWNNEVMGFEFKEIRSTTFLTLPIGKVEVIGNIYENPELLEVEF